MKPWMILAPLAFAASAHATELNLGAHLEGSPLVLSKLSPDGGWLAGAAVHGTWRLGPVLDVGIELGWSANAGWDDDASERGRLDLTRAVGQVGWGKQLGEVRLVLALEAGVGLPDRSDAHPEATASPAGTVGLLGGAEWAVGSGLELVAQLGGRMSVWSVEDGEGGDPQGQLAFPLRLGVQYRF